MKSCTTRFALAGKCSPPVRERTPGTGAAERSPSRPSMAERATPPSPPPSRLRAWRRDNDCEKGDCILVAELMQLCKNVLEEGCQSCEPRPLGSGGVESRLFARNGDLLLLRFLSVAARTLRFASLRH